MPSTKIHRVATDIGGTFTDLLALKVDDQGQQTLIATKSQTTHGQLQAGILHALHKAGIDIKSITQFIHGTTVVINALTEHKGVKTGLITTPGFRDVLEIARGARPDMFNLHFQKEKPLIERHLRQECPGRMSYKGKELEALDLSKIDEIIKYFRHEQVESIAICFINSYANPQHEETVYQYIKQKYPEFSVVYSTQLSQEWREYERTNTAVLSACVKPIVSEYIKSLSAHLKQEDFQGDLSIMQSNGGMASHEFVMQSPLNITESGPAAGIAGAVYLARLLNLEKIICFDVGGTTTKAAQIDNYEIETSTHYSIQNTLYQPGYPMLIPTVKIKEVGSGGGSIVKLNQMNQLQVGPESAGALPGPIAYGLGGKDITVTDAHLMIGNMNPNQFCGGERTANMAQVEEAFSILARKSECDSKSLARNVLRLANHHMFEALRSISVNCGRDPRNYKLVAYGGGGPLHAAYLGYMLNMQEVIIPKYASVFSAFGMLVSPVMSEYVQSQLQTVSSENSAQLLQILDDFTHRIKMKLKHADIQLSASMRYLEQEHHVEIPIERSDFESAQIQNLLMRFHKKYSSEYTYQLDTQVELVAIKIKATIPSEMISLQPLSIKEIDPYIGTRSVSFLDFGDHNAKIFNGELMQPGMRFDGPAVIERSGDTIIVLPHTIAIVDVYGNLHMDLKFLTTASITTALRDDALSRIFIQHSFDAITKEMFVKMSRCAMSAIIYEVLDMGTGILDKDGKLISSGAGIPFFAGILDKCIRAILLKYQISNDIKPNDIFLLNTPVVTHLNDVVVAKPVFHKQQLIAWAATIAHWSDIGGMAKGSLTSNATEIFQEGLQIPPIKIFNQGCLNHAVLTLLTANSRMPKTLEGDLMAGIAAVEVGANRIQEIVNQYSLPTFEQSIIDFIHQGETVTKAALGKYKGVYELSEPQEDDVILNCRMEITDDKLIIDLRNNPDQYLGPFNLSRDGVYVVAQAILKSITSPRTVCNAGTIQCLEVLTRPGSLYDPKYPAPMGLYFETLIRLHDFLLRTISQHFPHDFPAGSFASICGTLYGGKHPETGNEFTVVEPELGGWGASSRADGNSTVFSAMHGETYQCPAEITEAKHGVLVERMSLNNQYAGEGQYRGGNGVCIDYRICSPSSWLTAAYSRHRIRPWGLMNGREGSQNYVEIRRTTGESERHAVISGATLQKGDVIRIVTATGGGWGDPKCRDAKLIESDLINGYITDEQASRIYGYQQLPHFWSTHMRSPADAFAPDRPVQVISDCRK